MVRLVFRPYTRVGRAICTSAPLRASTRVSSGFALLRHSSPSFGSRHICSRSDLQSKIVYRLKLLVLRKQFAFAAPWGFLIALWLADVLHSLVRVSRRVEPHAALVVLERFRGAWSPPGSRKINRPKATTSRPTTWLHQFLKKTRLNMKAPQIVMQVRFYLRGFQVLVTLFSKCFSTFPRGTCLISVSHQYLAFDETYHRLGQHSQATRLDWNKPVRGRLCLGWTGLSPSTANIFMSLT